MDTQKLYNSPVEVAIRLLVLLEISKVKHNSDHLLYLEHLSLHTKDIGGEISLHAAVPNRGVQLYAKEQIIQSSLKFLMSKQLIDLHFTSEGFQYSANDLSMPFLSYFQSNYYHRFREKARFVIDSFGSMPLDDLISFFEEKVLNIQQ